MQNVIKGCKNHQHHDDRQPNPEPDFLRPLGQWPTANCLDRIEQKVTTVQQRDREQVQAARSRPTAPLSGASSATNPAEATCPETCAIRIGPPS